MSAGASSEGWPAAGRRWCKFSLVGAMGMVVQLGTLALLLASGMQYLLATAAAVEMAVLHNFGWHQNFTWKDRGRSLRALPGRLARFHLANGAISLMGNVLMMRLLVGTCGLPPLAANLITIAVCFAANFLAADRVVFLRGSSERGGARRSILRDRTVMR